jgi:hypothetical protein
MPLRAFEATVLRHLDATFNYARWLMKRQRRSACSRIWPAVLSNELNQPGTPKR